MRPLITSIALATFALAASCASPQEPQTAKTPRKAAAPTTASKVETRTVAPPVQATVAPPPNIKRPMKGEPAAAALKEARLVKAQYEDDQAAVKARITKMKAEVNVQFKFWHDEQPRCWREMREQWDLMWGDSIGEAFGAGGLGLSGIGHGGGGYGEGIGLGSIGTIGHGAGSGRRLPKKAGSVSGTNNQVAGVAEPDIVKTDGRYVYFTANGALRIAEAMDPKVLSVTGVGGTVRNMFISGDRAVVYASNTAPRKPCTYGYDCRFAGDGTSTHISVFDVSNRRRPKLARKIDLSGSLMASRRVGSAVHTVVADGDADKPVYETWPADLETCGVPEKTVKAKFAALKRENAKKIRASAKTMPSMKDNGKTTSLCKGALATPMGDGQAFTTIVSFDLDEDRKAPKTTMIQSRPGAVFASGEALYLSVVHNKRGNARRWYGFYPSVNEVSEIHKFSISTDASDTKYVGSGVVPGHVLNQFAMDEWHGYLRIATTRGRVPDPKVNSVVSVLAESDGGNLVRVGAIQDIAPGEDIRSVRFDAERGYIVTFKKTDPLFVIDLKHPAKPKVLGELKIPGFSTYMHRIDAGHLLSIGFDADDKGSFAYFDGIILQLFDVQDPTKPKLIHKTKIGSRGSSSEAATNHLAFNYLGQRGLLAVPMTECSGGGNGSYGKLSFSGLYIFKVSVDGGFERLGRIDHGTKGANCNTWWTNASSHVKRSLFLDDLVYSIASDRVKVQRLGKFGDDVATLSLAP